jgi:capsular exopolysaccharide synthesis family protein
MPIDMQSEDNLHLREYLNIVIKRKRIVLSVFVVVLAVGLLVSLRAVPLYKATTKLKVEQKNNDPLDIYSIARQDPAFFNSQIQIISSPTVMAKVVMMLNLNDTFSRYFPGQGRRSLIGLIKGLFNGSKEVAATAGDLPPGPADMSQVEKLAKSLLSGLSIDRVRDSNILNISYASRNPVFSAEVCNALPRAYIEQLLEMKMANTQYTIDWMEKKAAAEREKLEEAEHSLQDYLVAQDIVTIENRIAIIPERLSQINSQLTNAEAKQREIEMVVAQIDNTPRDALETIPAIAEDEALKEISEQIRQAEQEIIALSQKYGALHPVRIQAQKSLDELQQKKEQEISNVVKRLRNDLQLAQSNQENLNQQLTNIKAEAARLNEKFIQYDMLKREIDTKKQLYDALVSRIKEQTMTKQIRDVDVYVVEPARAPESPSNQNLPRNLLIAAVLGCLGGVGSALLLEYMDNTISLCQDAEERTGVKAIVAIPFIKDEEKRPENIVSHHPGSAEAESYKVVRTALSLSTSTGFPKSLMVTSLYPGDGKTITCANLAIAIAQAKRSVLLVDCDMRRPTLHKVLKKKSRSGFAEILAGQCDIAKAIQPTDIPSLRFIPAGTIPPNPSDLLAAEGTVRILKSLTENFDIVIFDTPPMTSVSDSSVLAAYVEKILFVTRSGVTRYEDLIRTMYQLEDAASKVVGQVVNAVDMERLRQYHPYYKYTGYYTDEE